MVEKMSLPRILIYLINFVIGIVELFIITRIILKLFGANPATPFVNWIYETSRGLIDPFAGMFPSPVIEGSFVIEFSAIFALIAYAVLAYLITELIEFVSYNSTRYRVVEREVVR